MKKSLLALAVLGAFAGVAQAQTSVTLYGSVGAGIRSFENAATGQRTLAMSSNGHYSGNRLGFRGIEDLGGGMNAHFTLESGFNLSTGALNNANNLLFQRSAFVGLGGAWGTVDLGRQYSVNFKTSAAYDPFGIKYVSIIPVAGLGGITRLDNDIQYTGAFGPVTVMAEYALGEQAGDTGAGALAALGASFKTGPFGFGGAYTTRANATDTADQNIWTVGGSFGTGPFRIAAGYANDESDTGFTAVGSAATEIENAWLGGSYNITPALALQAGFYRTETSATGAADGRSDLAIVGATYALSKRTNFYTNVDTTDRSGSAGTARTTGFSLGINHVF